MNFDKIHIYTRHFTRNKIHPQRPPWFNYDKTFGNLLATIDFNLCDLTVIFEREEDYDSYFVKKYEGAKPFKVKFIDTSKDKWENKTKEDMAWARSIAAAAKVIRDDNHSEQDLIYISDDDFLHVPNWGIIVTDWIKDFLPEDGNWWVCPCDYGDKYYFVDENHTVDQWGTDQGMYSDLSSKIRIGNCCYWRQVPNCLTSSIIPVKTFNRDFKDYWETGYSDCSLCHQIGLKYNTKFWTPMPSLSCHATDPFCPPFINWPKIQEEVRIKV